MVTHGLRSIVLAGVVALFATSAQGELVFTASLDGAQEVPPNATPATGVASLILNDAETQFTLDVSFSGLSFAQSDAHIHGFSTPGVDANVLYPLPPGSPIVGLVIPLADKPQGTIAEQVAALKAGLWYVNIHSTGFPGGEIRGQLNAVPEPASLILWLVGAIGLVGYFWRRRKQGS